MTTAHVRVQGIIVCIYIYIICIIMDIHAPMFVPCFQDLHCEHASFNNYMIHAH